MSFLGKPDDLPNSRQQRVTNSPQSVLRLAESLGGLADLESDLLPERSVTKGRLFYFRLGPGDFPLVAVKRWNFNRQAGAGFDPGSSDRLAAEQRGHKT